MTSVCKICRKIWSTSAPYIRSAYLDILLFSTWIYFGISLTLAMNCIKNNSLVVKIFRRYISVCLYELNAKSAKICSYYHYHVNLCVFKMRISELMPSIVHIVSNRPNLPRDLECRLCYKPLKSRISAQRHHSIGCIGWETPPAISWLI